MTGPPATPVSAGTAPGPPAPKTAKDRGERAPVLADGDDLPRREAGSGGRGRRGRAGRLHEVVEVGAGAGRRGPGGGGVFLELLEVGLDLGLEGRVDGLDRLLERGQVGL